MASRLHRWTPWLFALALLLYLRPYTGVRHDALLYLGQALNLLHPAVFSRDLFFAGGSQADYTIFPRLLALLLQHVAPGPAFLWLTLVGRIAFYAASWFLIRTMLPRKWAMPALFALLALPGRYGAYSIFAYAEPFLTPRPFAEALVLVALAFTIRARLALAACTILFAFLLHPLQALAGAIVAWCWLVLHDRRWLWCLTTILPVLGLALLDVKPFAGLLTTVDPDWWTVIQSFSSQVLVHKWDPRDWAIVVVDIYLLSLLRPADTPLVLARLARAALLAGAIGIGLTALLADLLRLQLPVALQLWRTLWCIHWLAVAATPLLVARAWKSESGPKVEAALLVGIVALGASLPRITLPIVALGFILLHMSWPFLRASVSLRMRLVLIAFVAVAILAGLVRYAIGSMSVFELFGNDISKVRQDVVLLSFPALTGALIFGAWRLHVRCGNRGRTLLGLATVAILVLSAMLFDSRSHWSRMVEDLAAADGVFGATIEEGATVYWPSYEESPLAPWLVLHRASYFTPGQMAGQMFNRPTSILGLKRFLQVEPIEQQFKYCSVINAMSKDDNACWLGDAGLSHLCTPFRDLAPPDYFVVPFKQRHPLAKWDVRVEPGDQPTTFHLYSCKDFSASRDNKNG